MEPQWKTPQRSSSKRVFNSGSAVRFTPATQYLEDSLKNRLRGGFATAQHLAGAAAMAFPCTPCGQEIF